MAMRGGLWQIRYTHPIEKREVRISTKIADETEAIEQRKCIEAKLQLGIEVVPRKKSTLGASMPWTDFREEYTRLKVATMRSEDSAEIGRVPSGRMRSRDEPADHQAIVRNASFTTTESYYLRGKAQDQGHLIAEY